MKLFNYIKNNIKGYSNWKRYSIKAKLLTIFIIISIIPIIFSQVFLYKLSQHYLEKKITSLTDRNLFYVKTNIETDMNYYKDTLYRITVDNDCLGLENMFNNGDEFEKAASINKIRDIFGSYSYSRSQIRAITFVGKDGRNVYYDKSNQGINNRVWNAYSDSSKAEIYFKILNSNTPVILPTTANSYIGGKSEYMFHMGLKVRDIRTKEEVGIIIMSFDEQVLSDVCNVNMDKKNSSEDKINMCSVVIDDEGRVISFKDKRYIGTFVKDYTSKEISDKDSYETLNELVYSIPNFTNRNISVSSISIESVGWKVINIVDKDNLFYEVNLLRNLTLALLAVIVIIVMGVIIIFSNKFYESVKIIVSGMKKAKKGNFNVKIELDTEDELAFIGEEFNEMLSTINILVEDIKKQSNYIIEISNKRREAEIKAIVAQINPHFLYNTLDCINWMAIKNENYEVSDTIGNFAQILRYSIGDINKEVTIYDEVEWLKKYVYLQQIRFNNSFELDLNVSEEILRCRIHKLILQPLIENSIIHGFKGHNDGGILKVNINKFQNNFIKIIVGDNGNGISEEKLERIIKNIKLGKDEDENIGLKNVYDRIKIYYGDNAEINIESFEGEGTIITLLISLQF
ncbi:histidine kinase [Clostridium sp. YIM B02555]|uniref:cache domain-containing sensor histidine kinase n=1 Tax=Clostridium sp. YIM B02555 TaxID=2911968 RepID=UPI001EEDF120|nr:histidine kinase [Clostridium sp. YIM B02555]